MTTPSARDVGTGAAVCATPGMSASPQVRRGGVRLLTRSGGRLDYDGYAVAMDGATGKGLPRG